MIERRARWAVDFPLQTQAVPRTGFILSGWVLDGARNLVTVVARHGATTVGMTAVPYLRDDVEPGKKCGYRIFVTLEREQISDRYEVDLFATFDDAADEVEAGHATCRLSTFDERTMDYGGVSEAHCTGVLRRDDIYMVGPPSERWHAETLGLLFSYIDAGASVLDVGCGAAPYARPFMQSGRPWAGCETRSDLVGKHIASGLPVSLVTAAGLPYPPASFDFAMCIEVLEHIDDYEAFVAEIALVVRRGALFTVPNIRAIPRLAPYGVVPWHLLESSHLNFFTAISLRTVLERHFARVDAFEFCPLAISASDDTPIFNHVFAVAMHA
jgi:2-polyprenyl-3-methyl-5-hydroxy-6-metoxy-1,4-benzoquinol methylase